LHGWQANFKRTCASPVSVRALPENEIPPAMRVDIYYISGTLGNKKKPLKYTFY